MIKTTAFCMTVLSFLFLSASPASSFSEKKLIEELYRYNKQDLREMDYELTSAYMKHLNQMSLEISENEELTKEQKVLYLEKIKDKMGQVLDVANEKENKARADVISAKRDAEASKIRQLQLLEKLKGRQ